MTRKIANASKEFQKRIGDVLQQYTEKTATFEDTTQNITTLYLDFAAMLTNMLDYDLISIEDYAEASNRADSDRGLDLMIACDTYTRRRTA